MSNETRDRLPFLKLAGFVLVVSFLTWVVHVGGDVVVQYPVTCSLAVSASALAFTWRRMLRRASLPASDVLRYCEVGDLRVWESIVFCAQVVLSAVVVMHYLVGPGLSESSLSDQTGVAYVCAAWVAYVVFWKFWSPLYDSWVFGGKD